jgi:hypothetical protein
LASRILSTKSGLFGSSSKQEPAQNIHNFSNSALNLETLKLFTEEDAEDQLPDDGAHVEDEGSELSNISPRTKCCKFQRFTKE